LLASFGRVFEKKVLREGVDKYTNTKLITEFGLGRKGFGLAFEAFSYFMENTIIFYCFLKMGAIGFDGI